MFIDVEVDFDKQIIFGTNTLILKAVTDAT